MRRVIVIGGGVAGMTAAITAANLGAQVTILEHKDRIGKKILSTGNGRCNFTNLDQKPEYYHSDNPSFPWQVYEQIGVQKIIAFFEEIGVYAKERNGYIYPNSDQATAVLDAYCMECNRLSIRIMTNIECEEILYTSNGFKIKTNQGFQKADSVILATGSKAAPVTGSDGSGYTIAKKLGHHLIPVLPALVQLRCKEKFYKSISGVRVQAKVSLYSEEQLLGDDTGEVQLTNYGISGIPVFQVSRFAARALYEKRPVQAILNFMPGYKEEEFLTFLTHRIHQRPEKTLDQFFVGLFHKKLADLWVKLSKISPEKKVGSLTSSEVLRLVHLIQHFKTEVVETNSYDQAQICCGGIDTKEINATTMESLCAPGVYLAGELLDVDGQCGGYNITFAVASGMLAGKGAATC